jgi:hypothetical protein
MTISDPPCERASQGEKVTINTGTRDADERAAPAHRYVGLPALDHGQASRPAHLPDLPDNKSRSTVSRPIFGGGSAIPK